MHDLDSLLSKAVNGENLTAGEAFRLYTGVPLNGLMAAADAVRRRLHPSRTVTWQIDRNVNITNVCVSGCRFCNFHCRLADTARAYVTTPDEYRRKIGGMLELGGDQLLLQGGLHPSLGIEFYEELFRSLKQAYPTVKLHALGPPEIAHITRLAGFEASGTGYRRTLERLMAAGLDSLPGAGAEILDNDIRRRISPGKCSADTWLAVMREAHALGLLTSATMMYGHIEEPRHRIEHLLKIRDLQAERPAGATGFISFIAWPFRGTGTLLCDKDGIDDAAAHDTPEFLRMIALARLVLHNVPNIQASWLTAGFPAAQLALHGGANDMGSIMIEENVVSAASSPGQATVMDAAAMQAAIRAAGFVPVLRDARYRPRHI